MSRQSDTVTVDNALEATVKVLHRFRRLVALAIYCGIAAFAYTTAFLLRFEFQLPVEAFNLYVATLPVIVGIRGVLSFALRLASGRWRFAGPHDVIRLGLATSLGTLLFVLIMFAVPFVPRVPRSIILFECVLTTFFTAGLWLTYRTVVEQFRHLRAIGVHKMKRTLIIGAGEAGSLLAREMTRSPTGYRAVGFVDDDPDKSGLRVYGLDVLGTTDQLAELTTRHRIDELTIAVPSASPENLRRIVHLCEESNVSFKVLPGISDVLSGEVGVNQLRDLRIEDLLGREPISLELPELYQELSGRSVLITGAAGSIGSELSRQVALHEPGVLILFDQSETALFYLERELRQAHPGVQMHFVMGDIVDESAVNRVFADFAPTRVFHAAAYKHVPMMQTNPREALRNNVLGTWRVADAAGRHETEKFLLISTDKAVRPTSVMGGSKRLAEMVTLDLQSLYPATAFAAVRFGNVLGSNGSVIPIFREQIEAGEPLTVTHPEVTRYFMTIPEAVQLVLQASLLSDVRGHIAMLEMGEPVRIVDLANNLLRLSGHYHRNGSRVVFTGLRPGEKLHEELVAVDETTSPTSIPKVRIVAPSKLTLCDVPSCMLEWETLFADGKVDSLVASLANIFPSLDVHAPRTKTQLAVSM